jgi:hypothetical protein
VAAEVQGVVGVGVGEVLVVARAAVQAAAGSPEQAAAPDRALILVGALALVLESAQVVVQAR